MADELRGGELKWAYWLNTHRQDVSKLARLAGILAVSVLWLVFFVYLIQYIRHYRSTQQAQESIILTKAIFDSIKPPQDLIIEKTDALEQTADTIDVYGFIQNPNQFYVARFSYTMTIQGQVLHYNDGIIMPASEGYIVLSGIAGASTASVALTINEIAWQRIKGQVPNINLAISELSLTNTELTNQATSPTTTSNVNSSDNTNSDFATPTDDTNSTNITTPGGPLTQLSATLTNSSPYGFRSVRCVGILKDAAGHIVGIQQITLDNLQSFATAPLLFHWQHRFAVNTQASIVTMTDAWDRANLIYPGEDSN